MKRNTKLKQLPSNLIVSVVAVFSSKNFSLKKYWSIPVPVQWIMHAKNGCYILNQFNWKLDQDLFSFCVDAFGLDVNCNDAKCEIQVNTFLIIMDNSNRIKEIRIGLVGKGREQKKKLNHLAGYER